MNNNKQIEDLINKVEELEDRIVKLEQINSRIRLGDRQSSARIKKLIESNPYLKKIYDDEKEDGKKL